MNRLLFELSSPGLGGGLKRSGLAGDEGEVQATTSCDWVDYCFLSKLKKTIKDPHPSSRDLSGGGA